MQLTRRAFMVGLAASAATVPLAACSPGSRTTASTSGGAGKASGVIKVAAFENAYGAAIYKQVAEAFEKATGAKVELTVSKTIDQELTPQVAAGNFPDVVFMGVGGKTGFTDKFVQNKSLEPLNDILKITNKGETTTVGDKLLPGMVGNLTTNPYDDDRLMLAPTFMAPAGLVYNKTLFTKNGWTLPATWDEFFALGDEFKAKGVSLFTYPTAGYFDTFFFALLSSIGGDDYFKKVMSYEKNIWTGSEATQALNLVGKLLTQYTLPQMVGYANNQDYTKNQAALMADKALFCPDGSWVAGEMKDAPRSAGFAWGLTTVPAMKKEDRHLTSFIESVWIPSGAKNKASAKTFIAWLYSDKATGLFAKAGAAMPTKTGTKGLPAEVAPFYTVYDEPGLKSTIGGFKSAKAVPGIDMKTALLDSVDSVASGKLSVKDWQAKVNEASNKLGGH